ncbi:MAG: hypothetical protein GY797_18130 [Deltaproteobacteria bacterium]|nr:hypothetical protein [Deltaproteobacteria bacterium]
MTKEIPITINFDENDVVGKASLAKRAAQALLTGMFYLAPTLRENADGSFEIIEMSIVPLPPTNPPAKQSKSSRIKKRRGYRRSETNKLKYY